MVEIVDLGALSNGDVDAALLLVVYDAKQSSPDETKKITLANLFANANYAFADLSATQITTSGALVFASDDQIDTLYTLKNQTCVIPELTAGSSGTEVITLTGVAVGDVLAFSFRTPPASGLIVDAYVSAANTITFRFHNSTSGTIATASPAADIVAMRTTDN